MNSDTSADISRRLDFLEPPASPSRPEDDRVDLWLIDLDPEPCQVRDLRATLDRQELDRAARFRFERHRRRFIVRRGAMRCLLGRYLDCAPADVTFRYTERGKPRLASTGASNLTFNLSDSEDLALLAVGEGEELGVDLEVIRPMSDAASIAQRFFSRREVESLMALAEDQRDRGFFNCWTRKEAYLKATGEGITSPLDAFAVTLRPDEPARFLGFSDRPGEAAHWSLLAFQPTDDSVGALARRTPGFRIVGYRWRPNPF